MFVFISRRYAIKISENVKIYRINKRDIYNIFD